MKDPKSKSAIEVRKGGVTQSAIRAAFVHMEIDQTISTHAYSDFMDRLQLCGYMLAEYGAEHEEIFRQSEKDREQSVSSNSASPAMLAAGTRNFPKPVDRVATETGPAQTGAS